MGQDIPSDTPKRFRTTVEEALEGTTPKIVVTEPGKATEIDLREARPASSSS